MTTLEELVELEPDPTHGRFVRVPGWGADGRWALEVADPSAGEDVVWHDITDYYVGDTYTRGASEIRGRYTASVAQILLCDEYGDGRLAPWREDTSALFGVHVPLGAGLLIRGGLFRVVSGETVAWHPTFTLRVESWSDEPRARGGVWSHQVTAVDLLSDLATAPTDQSDTEGWKDRVPKVLADAEWQFGYDLYGASDGGDPAIEFGEFIGESVTGALDTVCDSVGIVWRTLRTGRLLFYPGPFAQMHTDLGGDNWSNPILARYPSGIEFSWVADGSDDLLSYDLDDVNPFGIADSVQGVRNDIRITAGGTIAADDDPTSIARFGRRVYQATWVDFNPAAVSAMLDQRAWATKEATPLQTSLGQAGFFPAMAMIDHLDPTSVAHRVKSLVVAASGQVRTITETRQVDEPNGLLWESTLR